jgi:tetratricopeptide (TPR) repeat protein
MIFGDPTAKVEKQVRELSSPSAEKRLKAVAVLAEVAEQDLKPLKIALPALMDALGDGSADVRSAAAELLGTLAKSRAATRKEIVKGVLGRLPDYGDALAGALALLENQAAAAKDAVEEHLPALVELLEDSREDVRGSAREVLEQAGIPARRFCSGLAEAKAALEEASRCGADTEKADYMLRAARTAMGKGFHAEVDKDLELARELAQNARRLVRLWRMKAPDVRAIDLSSGARFVAAAGSDGKLRLVDASGAALWSASVAEGATALRISPDESMVVAAGGDGHLHAFGRRGERLWSFRMSAPAAALAVTDGNLTVACCNDNNIYTVGPAGALVSKQWTERPGRRLAVSGDGEQVVVTFRDHNVYCYDRNMFLRWKFSGGIWNDVAISRDGESVVAGAQGCDVAMFSKIGMVAWKARADEPVTNVAISAGGDCVYSADPHALQAWHRSGKPLLRYRTGDPVRCMACDSSGEYLAVGLADRFVLVRNREMVRLLVEQSGVLLDNVARLGVDTARPAALLEKARSAFEANDYEGGSSAAGEAWRLLDEAKNQRAEALVASVQQVIRDAKELGGDTAKAEQLVKGAAESLRRGHMDRVLLLLGQAREEAEISRRVREEVARAEKEARVQAVRKAIQEAMAATDEAVESGIEQGQAEVLLQKAIHAADTGEHDRAMHYIAQLQDHVKAEKEKLPMRMEKAFRSAVALIAKPELSAEEADRARGDLSGAIVYYEKAGELRRLAEAYERLGFLEEKRGKIPYSKFLYQKAVNTYFKIGEIDQVLLLLVERMKRLEAITDKKVTEYTIEELFLIYRDGRLIHHNTRRLRPEVDNQILGGMLIAIQHFVADSFRDKDHAKGDILNELRYGKTRIIIEGGSWVHLALVISGMEPEDMRERMRKTLADIEDKYRSTLETWDGDASKLWGAKKMVEPLITWM